MCDLIIGSTLLYLFFILSLKRPKKVSRNRKGKKKVRSDSVDTEELKAILKA